MPGQPVARLGAAQPLPPRPVCCAARRVLCVGPVAVRPTAETADYLTCHGSILPPHIGRPWSRIRHPPRWTMAIPRDLQGVPQLVGRAREQVVLRECLDAALAGQGSLVLIGGEAGIGKTALAEWLLAEAATRGAL